MSKPIEYDAFGRMRYHPEFHPNHKKDWKTSDEKYVIENYLIDGPEAVSLALGRTVCTIMERAKELRHAGRMPPRPKGAKFHRRARAEVDNTPAP